MIKQRSIQQSVNTVGIALHSGRKIQLTLSPAPANTGIVFRRTDFNPPVMLPANALQVGDTRMASTLQQGEVKVATVEHLMSACAGIGIDNLYIDLDGAEVPIMDGSAASFVYLLLQGKIVEQAASKQFIRVKRPIEVRVGEGQQEKWVRLSPFNGFKLQFFIEFNHPAIDKSGQVIEFDFAKASYIKDIARARTFGFIHEVETLRQHGLAQGGSLENAIVMDEHRILNAEGLRYADEFVRHKVLDAIGDLYLAGHPLLASYEAHKAGHDLNNKLLRALFADSNAYEIITLDATENIKTAPLEYLHPDWLLSLNFA